MVAGTGGCAVSLPAWFLSNRFGWLVLTPATAGFLLINAWYGLHGHVANEFVALVMAAQFPALIRSLRAKKISLANERMCGAACPRVDNVGGAKGAEG